MSPCPGCRRYSCPSWCSWSRACIGENCSYEFNRVLGLYKKNDEKTTLIAFAEDEVFDYDGNKIIHKSSCPYANKCCPHEDGKKHKEWCIMNDLPKGQYTDKKHDFQGCGKCKNCALSYYPEDYEIFDIEYLKDFMTYCNSDNDQIDKKVALKKLNKKKEEIQRIEEEIKILEEEIKILQLIP